MLSFNDSLLSIYNVTLKLVNGTNQFKLSGIAQAIEYEKVIQALVLSLSIIHALLSFRFLDQLAT